MLKRRRAAIINKQSVPYGMEKVEYLESTGSQRIDTGLSVTPTIGAKVTASVTDTPASSSNFKTTTGSSSMFSVANAFYKYPPKYRISFAYSNNPTDINYYVCKDGSIVNSNESGTMTDENFLAVNTFEPFIAELNYKNDKKYKFKNQEHNLIVDLPNTITSTYNESITLFVRRYAPNANNFTYGWNGIIYNATYTEGDEIKINFIPCLDRTGTPCMFDKITCKRFYNAGTGDFLYPTTSTTYSLRRPQAEYAKMTDTGIHRLYHVPADYEGSLEDYAIQYSYKQLIETECPNEEGKYYSFRWVETDDTLTTEWFEVDPPQEEFFE